MPTGIYERTPEHNAANSKAQKNSKAAKAANEAKRGVPLPPKWRAAIKEGMENSDAVKAKADAQRGVPLPPEHCDAIAEGHAESDIMRGGNDLCWHHVAYDFGRPEALRVLITRSFHSQIHSPKGQGVHKRGYSLID